MKRPLATAAAATGLALLAGSVQANTLVATISGGYDLLAYDTPSLIFHNPTSFDYTNAQMVLTGLQGVHQGLSQTVSLGTMAANADTNVIWGNGVGPFFLYDYDDTTPGQYGAGYSGPACPPSPINGGLCGQPGNFQVTFTATWNGQSIFAQFSPETNATGGFVAWEGLDAAGLSEDPCCDVHNGSVTGTLANIFVGTPPVPEPASLAILSVGLLGLGFAARRNR